MHIEEDAEPAAGPVTGRAMPAARWRRNFVCLTLDAAFFFFGLAFVDASIVLPSLLGHLTALPVLVGLVGAISTGFWLLPQLLVARVVVTRRRKLPMVIAMTTASRLSWGVLLAALLRYEEVGPASTVIAAYVSVALFWFFDSVASLAWYDLIARAVPSTVRGRLFGLMSLSGGSLAILSGLIVQRVVGRPDLPYPADYRVLLIAAIGIFAVGVVPLLFLAEPEGELPPPPEPLAAYIRRLPGFLRHRHDFQRLVGVQLLVGASGLAVPFYALFGVQQLGVPESDVGAFVVGVTVGSTLGGMAWGYLGDRGRKETAIRLLAGCAALAPVVALGLRLVAPVLPASTVGAVLVVSFFFIGCSLRASWIAYANYVIEIAAAHERPVLLGLMNTLGGTLAVAPPIGGLLAGWFGYEATFMAAAVPALAALALSGRLGAARRAG
ncbi:MAG: MFS transporter [Chloroflexi bacterium]|nr:MFS transporter [Chloroflexota bacterium]